MGLLYQDFLLWFPFSGAADRKRAEREVPGRKRAFTAKNDQFLHSQELKFYLTNFFFFILHVLLQFGIFGVMGPRTWYTPFGIGVYQRASMGLHT